MDPKLTADTSASDIHAQDSSTNPAPATEAPTMQSVVAQLPLPKFFKDWMVCIRKPAISLQYSINKRHIPDLDAEPQAGASASENPASAPAPSSAPTADASATDASAVASSATDASTASDATMDTTAPAKSSAAKGKNTDLMTLSGGLTIRYFDLGVGVLGLVLAGCLLRGGCRIGRMLK